MCEKHKNQNDRFKFRVWDKFNDKYIDQEYGQNIDEFLTSDHPLLGHDGCLWEVSHALPGYLHQLNINDYIIEQSTGIKDPCGKLIYEGDVVEFDHPMADKHHIGVITFDNNESIAPGFCIKVSNETDGHKYSLDGRHWRVVGNCHDWQNSLIERPAKNGSTPVYDDVTAPVYDDVTAPAYYVNTPFGLEVRKITEHYDPYIAAALQYIFRNGQKVYDGLTAKESAIKDLRKAIQNIKFEIEKIENS